MTKVIDMTGQRYGRLTVVSRAENDKNGKAHWWCQCDCGSPLKSIDGAALRKGLVVSCGCNKLQKLAQYNQQHTIDEIGNVYGYLTVISRNTEIKNGRAMWNCKCKCGNDYVVSGKLLRQGKVTSCGCRTQSIGEETVEKILLQNNFEYSKEYLVDVRKEKIYQHHKARFDFAIFKNNNLQYFIEYDGLQHFKENIRENGLGWNCKDAYEKTHERDELKNNWCKENNIPLIRIPYTHLKELCLDDLILETSKFIIK